ncbi:cytochrome D ubiquinol oxidase subunit II [Nitrospira sp.]|nr:cytochrome D ubiquinol oxidase subunit II [Nitrospira sp.]
MSAEILLAGSLVVSLVLYVITGGADFGAGVWSALAVGERGTRRRKVIDHAIAPIWEANHVWLILIVTILFTGFPRAWAVISTVLHIPLTLLLVGVVLRGAAFAFRTNDVELRPNRDDAASVWWARVFGWSSILTSIMLGIVIGAIAGGNLAVPASPSYYDAYVAPWLGLFPLLVGAFALALFGYLAAIYLTFETGDADLRDDFRRRGLAAGFVAVLVGITILVTAATHGPDIHEGLATTAWGWAALAVAGVGGAAGLCALWMRAYRTARACTVVQVTVIVFGWAASQYPYLVPPSLTIGQAAAPDTVLELLLWCLAAGALLLFPSLYVLYRVFKPHTLDLPNVGGANTGLGAPPDFRAR